jgi:tripartite ATP-independent transporter DctP family solute receptor
MKRAISILLVTVFCTALLFGCAPATTTPPANGGTNTPAPSAPADNTVYTITLAHATAETTSLQAAAVKFKENVEAKSNGRFVVNIYPNAQMGGDREAIEGCQNGNITIYASSTAPQVNFVPEAVIFDMPFVFPDVATARKVLNDDTFKAAGSKAYEKAGFHDLGWSDQGFRTLTGPKAYAKPDDLKGVSIRTMENKYHMEVWKSIGANPTPLAFNELYTALQQKTMECQENPIELIYSQKFYEQQKYIIFTNHILQPINWIMNKDFYDSLPDDLKKIIDEEAPVIVQTANDFTDSHTDQFLSEMKAYGTETADITPENRALFKEKAASTYAMIKQDAGAEVYDAFAKAAGL